MPHCDVCQITKLMVLHSEAVVIASADRPMWCFYTRRQKCLEIFGLNCMFLGRPSCSTRTFVVIAVNASWQTGRQAGRQTGRQTDRQADRQAGRQAGKQAGKQMQAGRYTEGQADMQASWQTVACMGPQNRAYLSKS